jgi:hypothetical protein
MDDRCGIWTTDQRLIGCIDLFSRAAVGQLTDPDSCCLAECELLPDDMQTRRALGWPKERWSAPLPASVRRVSAGDRLIGWMQSPRKDVVIHAIGAARPWVRRDSRDECIVSDGEHVLAAGRSRRHSFGDALRGDTWLTTALALHPDLSPDQRLVVMFAIIRRLGPPTSPPAD